MLEDAGGSARALTAAGLADRYPHLHVGGGLGAVLEDQAGVLLAERVLAACVGWLKWQRGIELIEHRAVTAVDGESGSVRLVDGRVLRSDAVLMAVGPWSRDLLPASISERLTLYRQSLLYCRVPRQQSQAWAATPAIPALGTEGGAWLIPPVAGTALKLTSATACRAVDGITDYATDPYWQRKLEKEFGTSCPASARPGSPRPRTPTTRPSPRPAARCWSPSAARDSLTRPAVAHPSSSRRSSRGRSPTG